MLSFTHYALTSDTNLPGAIRLQNTAQHTCTHHIARMHTTSHVLRVSPRAEEWGANACVARARTDPVLAARTAQHAFAAGPF